jgi:hypothetical protein
MQALWQALFFDTVHGQAGREISQEFTRNSGPMRKHLVIFQEIILQEFLSGVLTTLPHVYPFEERYLTV